MNNLTAVGQKIPKRDAPPKAIGAAQYIQDMKVQGCFTEDSLQQARPCKNTEA